MNKENYLRLAQQAAELERAGDLKPAGDMWIAAKGFASATNAQWCEHRAESCKVRGDRHRT